MTDSIETYTGKFFNFATPRVADVDIEDIAHGLAHTCRFGGHCSTFYSVAEHAVRVSWLVQEWTDAREFYLPALHHDSHEAYLGDIPTPLKRRLGPSFATMADAVDVTIAAYLGVAWASLHVPVIKDADAHMLRVEAGQLKPSRGVGPHWPPRHGDTPPPAPYGGGALGWPPEQAKAVFLSRHRTLVEARAFATTRKEQPHG